MKEKAFELNDMLRDQAVIHWEFQGKESSHFRSLFRMGFLCVEGTYEQQFRQVDRSASEKRMFRVQGDRFVSITVVPANVKSLNSANVFVVDAGDAEQSLHVWLGSQSTHLARLRAVEFAMNMRDQMRGGHGVIRIQHQGQELATLWSALGGRGQVLQNVSRTSEHYEPVPNTCAKIVQLANEGAVELIGDRLTRSMLKDDGIFVVILVSCSL